MDEIKFRQAMIANRDTQTKLAEALGLSQSGISDRINGKTDFKLSEINFIIQRYHLSPSEANTIFFADLVSEKDTKEARTC